MSTLFDPLPLILAQETELAGSFNQLGTSHIVLGGYLIVLLILGVFGWLKSKAGEEDYYLAGREQGWMISSLTIMATFFSSFALLGAPGMVYREGIVFALFSLNVPVAGASVYLLGSRIWKIGRHFGFVTPGDMIADYYGSRVSLRLLVALAGFLYVIPYVVMQIRAGGIITKELFGDTLFGGESFVVGSILLAGITTAYIMIGGMRSVAWTDLIQGLLLISGMLVGGMAMLFIFQSPQNFSQRVMTELPQWSQTVPGTTGTWTWTMLLSVCLLASVGSMVQPAQWMRFYAARDVKTLRRGAAIFALVLTSCFILGVMLIGLAGQLLYPLEYAYSVPVQTNAQLTIPAELQSHLQLQREPSSPDATLQWKWSGATPDFSAVRKQQLLDSSDDEALQAGIKQLYALANRGDRPTSVQPNAAVGSAFDSILVVVLHDKLPEHLGTFGSIFASLLLVAIMAASMSTADSNLHALSAVLTRDVYDRFIRPTAGETERVWVGRGLILAATVLALAFVIAGESPGKDPQYDFMKMIAQMGLMAIAFSAQLLPITIDILFLRLGSSRGAACGLAAGLVATFVFGPLFNLSFDALGATAVGQPLIEWIGGLKAWLPVHGSVWGLAVNVPVFAVVSLVTQGVPIERRQQFAKAMK